MCVSTCWKRNNARGNKQRRCQAGLWFACHGRQMSTCASPTLYICVMCVHTPTKHGHRLAQSKPIIMLTHTHYKSKHTPYTYTHILKMAIDTYYKSKHTPYLYTHILNMVIGSLNQNLSSCWRTHSTKANKHTHVCYTTKANIHTCLCILVVIVCVCVCVYIYIYIYI